MSEQKYIYGIDDLPPLKYLIVYGLQWAIIAFPTLLIVTSLAAAALRLDVTGQVRFFQLTLLTSGLFTAVQSLWGHRYPLLEGPATALLLTFIVISPNGIEVIQGGTIAGALLVIGVVLFGQLKKLAALATPNVIGVILMLISFALLPQLTKSMIGATQSSPNGNAGTLLLSTVLVIFMATLAFRLKGIWRTLALLIGMLIGTAGFCFIEIPAWQNVSGAHWFSLPPRIVNSVPTLYWPAVGAFASCYVAAVVNSLGSIHGIANITDKGRLSSSVDRGILFNGVAGVICGFAGTVGMVSYSMSPGVVLANRVASRFATAMCGAILVLAAFIPKLAAALALIPIPVVGAAMCMAMGTQIGAALAIVSEGGITPRDYFVVGVPVIVGTLVGFLPEALLMSVPPSLRVFLGNGLIMGIVLVLLMEHVLMRPEKALGEQST